MKPLTRDTVLFALAMHHGQDNGVRACDLVAEICGETSPAMERHLRAVVDELRKEGHHICGMPSTGYYIAATKEELQRTCEWIFSRSINGIEQVAAMQRVSLPDLAGQLRIRLENPPGGSEGRPDQPAVSDPNSGSQSRAVHLPGGDLAPTRSET